MKPFFSIAMKVMPLWWSSDNGGDMDEIRLTLAQYTESSDEGDDGGQLETIENVSVRIGQAMEWLSHRFRLKSAYFYECVAGELLRHDRLPLEEYLEKEVDCGDADFGDMIRRIAKKCEDARI